MFSSPVCRREHCFLVFSQTKSCSTLDNISVKVTVFLFTYVMLTKQSYTHKGFFFFFFACFLFDATFMLRRCVLISAQFKGTSPPFLLYQLSTCCVTNYTEIQQRKTTYIYYFIDCAGLEFEYSLTRSSVRVSQAAIKL